MSKIAIIDYGAGNVQSVKYALERLGLQSILTNKKREITKAEKVIFPGVGQAGNAMKALTALGLDKLIPTLRQPFLGICLGMQLLCKYSEEGNSKGLEIFPVSVRKFDNQLKVPQIGWNRILNPVNKLFDGIPEQSFMYFVHSYYVPINDYTIAHSVYGSGFSAAIMKDNYFGCQFHPEKSGNPGQLLLQNFIML